MKKDLYQFYDNMARSVREQTTFHEDEDYIWGLVKLIDPDLHLPISSELSVEAHVDSKGS